MYKGQVLCVYGARMEFPRVVILQTIPSAVLATANNEVKNRQKNNTFEPEDLS